MNVAINGEIYIKKLRFIKTSVNEIKIFAFLRFEFKLVNTLN